MKMLRILSLGENFTILIKKKRVVRCAFGPRFIGIEENATKIDLKSYKVSIEDPTECQFSGHYRLPDTTGCATATEERLGRLII